MEVGSGPATRFHSPPFTAPDDYYFSLQCLTIPNNTKQYGAYEELLGRPLRICSTDINQPQRKPREVRHDFSTDEPEFEWCEQRQPSTKSSSSIHPQEERVASVRRFLEGD